MKKIFSIIAAFLAGAMMFSCADPMEDTLELGTEISVDTEKVEFEAEENEPVVVNVTSNGTWMVAAPQWLKVTPMMGESGTTAVTISVTDNMETVVKEDGSEVVEMAAPRAYDLVFAGEDACVKVSAGVDKETGEETFKYVQATATVKVSQVGDPEKAKAIPVTIAEFNAAAEDATKYQLTGVITEIKNDKYGNIYIEDETASTYLYGLVMYGEDGTLIKQYVVEALGLKVGDTLVVEGTRGSYGETIEMINALYVSHISAEGGEEPEEPETPEDPETPAATTVANLDAIEGYGLYNIETATVVAVEYSNMVVKGTEKMLNVKKLASASANYAIGDVIKLTNATVKDAYGVTVIDGEATDLVIEKTGTATVEHGEATAIDAAWVTSFTESLVPEYVTVSGVGAASGSAFSLNIAVEGSDINMSVTLPTKDEVTALVGKNVTATGYAFDYNSKNKYVSIMKVELTVAEGGETPEEPEEPETPVELAGTGEGTLESPYDVVRAKAAIDAYTTVSGVYVKGVVTTSEIKFKSDYSSCDYYISVDGTTENELQVYSGKFVDGADFTSADQIHAGDVVVVCGDLKKHYETYEFNYSSKIVSLTCNHETTEPEQPEGPVAYTMTLGVTADAEGVYAPNANIEGLAKSFKEHSWTATDDSGKDTITFTGTVYYRDKDETVWYFNKKNAGTTVSAEGFGKVKKVTITLGGKKLAELLTCTDKEGNAVQSVETGKTETITWEFANATDGFTITGVNTNEEAEDQNYYQDMKVSKVVIEYEK